MPKPELRGVAARISQVLGGMKQAYIAEQTGLAASVISRCMRGEQLPSAEVLHALLLAFDINPTWLLTGTGPVEMGVAERSAEARPAPARSSAEGRGEEPEWGVSAIYEPGAIVISAEHYEGLPASERKHYVPIVGLVQCGRAVEHYPEQPVGWADRFLDVDIEVRDPHAIAVELDGDSMTPAFRPGDFILCSPSMMPVPNEPAVIVLHSGEAAFKHWRQNREGVTLRLTAYNPDYPPQDLDVRDVRRILPLRRHLPLMRRTGG